MIYLKSAFHRIITRLEPEGDWEQKRTRRHRPGGRGAGDHFLAIQDMIEVGNGAFDILRGSTKWTPLWKGRQNLPTLGGRVLIKWVPLAQTKTRQRVPGGSWVATLSNTEGGRQGG
jgi:hypothetical protein